MRFLDAKITAPNTAAVINPIVAGNGNSGVGVGLLVEPPADGPAGLCPGITITALSSAGDDEPVMFRTCVL